MRRTVLLGLAAIASLSAPAYATGRDEKQACLAASDKGQQLKIDGKLTAAREQFLICERAECPTLVRQDCAQWLSDIIAALPSVVIGARDAQGQDVMAVRVTVDGAVLTEQLDGKPIPLDPGAHKFRYEAANQTPIEEQVLVRQGEKNRTLTITFPAPPGAEGAPKQGVVNNAGVARVEPNAPAAQSSGGAGVSPMVFVFGGVGLIALGTALYFDLSANSDVNALRDPKTGCAPNCSSAQVDPIRTKYVVSGVSLGVGVVSLGVAAYFLIAKPGAPRNYVQGGAASIGFDVLGAPGGGVAVARGSF